MATETNKKNQQQKNEKKVNEEKTGMTEVRRRINELYEFTKDKSNKNVHLKIKQMATAIKAAMTAAEREHNALMARVVNVENALEEAKKHAMLVDNPVTPTGHRPEKRDRETPGEDDGDSKKPKQAEDENDSQDDSGGWNTVESRKKKKDKPKEGPKEEQKDESKKEEQVETENEEKKDPKDPKNPKDPKDEQGRKKVEKQKEQGGKKKGKPKSPRERNKGEALIIEVKEGTSYADLLRKVRMDPALKEVGENVVKTRRTLKGEMLFELKRDPAVKSSAFKTLIESVIGDQASVKALSPESVIECRNLDEATTEEDLGSVLQSHLGELSDVPMTIRLRKAYGGMQIATIRLSTSAANKLLEIGRVKVWWSVCSLKAVPRVSKQLTRCFKCMDFGHLARICEGPDRSKLCRKCGGEDHIAKDCKKQPRCLLCKDEDGNNHMTGGPRCPVYKQAAAGRN